MYRRFINIIFVSSEVVDSKENVYSNMSDHRWDILLAQYLERIFSHLMQGLLKNKFIKIMDNLLRTIDTIVYIL